MNVWSGTIALDKESRLQGIQLIDRSSNWQSDIAKGSTLNLRCFVNPALIPLYARAGPNLELHTSDQETAQWLKDKLLGNLWLEDEIDTMQVMQCPVGLLAGVTGTMRTKSLGSMTTTDLLIHGVLSRTATFERPPTPPVSSSPSTDGLNSPVVQQQLRIYATPLSSSLITKARSFLSPPSSDTLAPPGQFAEFLPDLRSPSPKRKRVATLFDSVAEHHKRVRQSGGEAVSQLMAHSQSNSRSSQQLHPTQIKRESEEPSLPAISRIAAQRSRSLSIGTGKPPLDRSEASQQRPCSNQGPTREFPPKRAPSIHFREPTVPRESEPPALEGEVEFSSTPKDAKTIVSENKNTITRTILTCMRLYGYNRPSTRSGSSTRNSSGHQMAPPKGEAKDSGAGTHHTDEDEFKAMYHATYRASTFALRKYLNEPALSEDSSSELPVLLEKSKAMTYIDEFLRLFCEES